MRTININFYISGTKITIPFRAICSVTNKKFSGDIIIEYWPRKRVLEYVDAENAVIAITKRRLTVEELAHKTFELISKSIMPKYLMVMIDVKRSKAHQPVEVWIERKAK